MKTNNMMLYTTATNGEKTFGLLPLNSDCPFNEAIYMPKLEALAILSKSTRDTFTMLERLDENGEVSFTNIKDKETGKTKHVAKQQRVQVATPWEYFINEKDEIREFIRMYAVNADSFDYAKFMTSLEVVEQPKIYTGQ
jgi:hypothetical protein